MRSPYCFFQSQTRSRNFSRAEVVAGETFVLAEVFLDLDLGRDSRVVGSGNPERGEALHTLVADEDVLKRLVKRVTHVELSRDVWGRNNNGKRFLFGVAFGREIALLAPSGVDTVLELGGRVVLWQIDFGVHSVLLFLW